MTGGPCIILGGGHAAAQLAAGLRQQGWQDGISLISEEEFLPYHRPPLSKDFLAGRKQTDDLPIRPRAFYEKAGVELRLGQRAREIDRANKCIRLDEGSTLPYRKLILATGASVRELKQPGAELDGVCYLRNIRDVERIKRYVAAGKKAVIIGAGYIGLETAAVLRRLGMDVVLLEAQSRVLERVTSPEVSAFFTALHAREGVRIRTNTLSRAIKGNNGRVTAVETEQGEAIETDLVVVGIGVTPRTDLAEAAGLRLDDGILVDEYACTSDPDIFAAGDCTRHYNPIYDRYLRLESVQNAVEQANIAAAALCGKPKAYHALPWFWSDQYDVKLQIAGLSQGYDKIALRGNLQPGMEGVDTKTGFAAFYLRGNRLLAVDAINRPQEFMLGKRLILAGTPLDAEQLADESLRMQSFLHTPGE